MKIAVISGYRTRSTALQEYLCLEYKHKNLFEYYNVRYNPDIANYFSANSKPLHEVIELSTKKLLDTDNFVIKIIGGQLPKIDQNVLNALHLNNYDQLHLIERDNFFDSCCSYQKCIDTGIWFEYTDEPNQSNISREFKLSKDIIYKKAVDIVNYLEIKKFLIDHNLNYRLYNYNDNIFSKDHISYYKKTNIQYNKLCENSKIESKLNELFLKHFDYGSCKHNLKGFQKDLFFL